MPELIAPTERLAASFAEAVDEFIAEGRGASDDRSLIGRMIRDHVRNGGVLEDRRGEKLRYWVPIAPVRAPAG